MSRDDDSAYDQWADDFATRVKSDAELTAWHESLPGPQNAELRQLVAEAQCMRWAARQLLRTMREMGAYPNRGDDRDHPLRTVAWLVDIREAALHPPPPQPPPPSHVPVALARQAGDPIPGLARCSGRWAQAWDYSVTHSTLRIRLVRPESKLFAVLSLHGCHRVHFESSWHDAAIRARRVGERMHFADGVNLDVTCGVAFLSDDLDDLDKIPAHASDHR